jgi:hypothetical protein
VGDGEADDADERTSAALIDRWCYLEALHRPAPRAVRSPLRLSLAEREEISRGLAGGESLRVIAARLGRAASTVSREVAADGGRRRHRACRADERSSNDTADPGYSSLCPTATAPTSLPTRSRRGSPRCPRNSNGPSPGTKDLRWRHALASPSTPCRRRSGSAAPRGHSFGLCDGPGGVHERDVGEGLREVAEQFAGGGVDLLGEESAVVGVARGSLEGGAGMVVKPPASCGSWCAIAPTWSRCVRGSRRRSMGRPAARGRR